MSNSSEIKSLLPCVKGDLDLAHVKQHLVRIDRDHKCGQLGAAIAHGCQQVYLRGVYKRLVALDVDDILVLPAAFGKGFETPVGTTRVLGACINRLAAKSLHVCVD